jgi:hypothetical protein
VPQALLVSDLDGRNVDWLGAFVLVGPATGFYPLINAGDQDVLASNRTVVMAVVMDQWTFAGPSSATVAFGSGMTADWRGQSVVTSPGIGGAAILTFSDATPVYASSTLLFQMNLVAPIQGTFRVSLFGWQI